MGSIVTSIGRAISGFFEKIKDFLPVLLIAAGIYLGYGYMTGFQSGGWPQIINWGKSLISGVTQGETISAATAAADATAGTVEATALPALEAVESTAIPTGDIAQTVMGAAGGDPAALAGDVASTVAEAGQGIQWSDTINRITDETTKWAADNLGSNLPDLSRGILNSLNPVSTAEAGMPFSIPDKFWNFGKTPDVEGIDGMGFPGSEGTYPGVSPTTSAGYVSRADLESAADIIPHPQEGQAFYNKFLSFFGPKAEKAWNIYKNMWSDNPGMAMWTTSNVLKTILALLDDSAEKESYRRRHVAGFAPGNWDEVAKRYGGNLPGGRGGGAGYSTAGRRPSSGLKVGRLPEASASRTSAIDRKPAGIIGPNTQRTV